MMFKNIKVNNVKYALLLFLCCSCFFNAFAQEIIVRQKQFNFPVIMGKKDNLLTQILIELPGKTKVNLESIVLEKNGSLPTSAIKSIRIYALQDSLVPKKIENSILIASVTGWVPEITLKKSKELSNKEYLWLSVELNDDVDQFSTLSLTAKSVELDGHSIQGTVAKPLLQRVAKVLRKHNDDNAHTYRIPGLATTNNGTLLAVYDVRWDSARDLQGNIDIGLSRSIDKGHSWEPMKIIMDMGVWGGLPQKFNGVSDPCILVDKKTGDIYVAALWMHGVLDKNGEWIEGLTEDSDVWNHQWRDKGSQPGFFVKKTSQFMIIKSTDDGKTWSKPKNITQMGKEKDWWLWAPAPGQGITLADGTLVLPTQGRDKKGNPFSTITYSRDRGETWETGNPASTDSTTENMAVELTDGSVMLNMRSNSNRGNRSQDNGRVIATTKDLGKTWDIHATSKGALPEPTCMASIIRHNFSEKGNKKSILLFSNPDSKISRNNMTIKVSYDDGKSWSKFKKIQLDQGSSKGYSCLTSIDEDTIGIVYESSQADLVFQAINLKELL